MKTIVVCAIAGALLLAAAAAWAQPEPQAAALKTVITFGEITITGKVVKPDSEVILGRPIPAFPRLIEHKDTFVTELLNSVEKL